MIRNYDFDFEEDDIPKHVKKREPSPKTKKSKHKHEYKDCLLIVNEYGSRPYFGSYCIHCGKIKDFILPTEKIEDGSRMLTDKEVFEKYEHLEKFYVEDLWQKHVSISK